MTAPALIQKLWNDCNSANLPPPAVIAAEIVEDLRAALAQFEEIEADLKE